VPIHALLKQTFDLIGHGPIQIYVAGNSLDSCSWQVI
jgi:hypothetical protein